MEVVRRTRRMFHPNPAPVWYRATAPLSGVLAGKPWRGAFAQPSWFGSKDETRFDLNVLEREESGFSASFKQPHLILRLPKKEGYYPLSGTFNVTFYEPPGNNVCATEGSMMVVREGNTYKVGLVAYADKLNNASGTFTYVEGKMDESAAVRQERDRVVPPVAAPKPVTPPAPAVMPRELAPSSGKELRVKAFIDGTDVLKVKGNELWYEHKSDALPGKWDGNNKPTYVNKSEWMPEWEGPISRPFEKVKPPFLPKPGATASIAHKYGRGNAAVVEQPSDKNGQTLSIQLSDPDGGADWLEVVIRW